MKAGLDLMAGKDSGDPAAGADIDDRVRAMSPRGGWSMRLI
jgi:hypothetical protein